MTISAHQIVTYAREPFCGNPAAPAEYAPAPDPLDETMVRPDPNDPGGRL